MDYFKKIIIFTLLLFILLPLTLVPSYAQDREGTTRLITIPGGKAVEQSSADAAWNGKAEKKVYNISSNGAKESVEYVSTGYGSNVLNLTSCLLVGCPEIYIDKQGTIVEYIPDPGLMDTVVATTGQLYINKPIQPATYQIQASINNLKEKFSLVETVQAAPEDKSTVYFPGLGWNILEPIRGFWNMNRNLAYGLMIVVIFVVAIGMLFSQKLTGKDSISLMNSLPSIIVSLLLITFSYSFAGLFIDVITIGSNLVQSVLLSSPGAPGQNIWQGEIIWSEFGDDGAVGSFLQAANQNHDEFIKSNEIKSKADSALFQKFPASTGLQIDDPLVSIWLVFGTANLDINPDELSDTEIFPSQAVLQTRTPIGPLVNSLVGMIDNNKDGISNLASTLLNIVFAFAAFMASFRIFLTLLKEWIVLVLYPILSPFIFLAAAIPSMTGKIVQSFIHTMLGSALSFVAVYAVFLFIIVISNVPLIQGFQFAPPLLGYGNASGVGTGGEVIRVLMGYALFLSTPAIPDAVKTFVKSQNVGNFLAEAGKETTSRTKESASRLFGLGQGVVKGKVGSVFPG